MRAIKLLVGSIAVIYSTSGFCDGSVNYPIVVSNSPNLQWAPIPLHFQGSSYLQIDGVGDLTATQGLLAPYGYFPIVVGPNLAAWSIFAAQHVKSNLPNGKGGGYNEAFIAVAASRNPNTPASVLNSIFNLGTVPPDFGFLVVKIWVDDETAKVVGNEVWGFNKDLASISVSLDPSQATVGFSLEDHDTGTMIMSESTATPTTPRPADLNFYVLTRFTKATAIFTGNGAATVTDVTALTPPLPPGDSSVQPTFSSVGWGAFMANYIKFEATRKSLVADENLDVGLPQTDN